MHNFKARISNLEKRIKPKKQLVRIYWADGTLIGELSRDQSWIMSLMYAKLLQSVLISFSDK